LVLTAETHTKKKKNGGARDKVFATFNYPSSPTIQSGTQSLAFFFFFIVSDNNKKKKKKRKVLVVSLSFLVYHTNNKKKNEYQKGVAQDKFFAVFFFLSCWPFTHTLDK
jgi:hypothetical protein